jgi:hypothetical protein
LESPEKGEIKQMNDNVHDRLLVQAVVAKSGQLLFQSIAKAAVFMSILATSNFMLVMCFFLTLVPPSSRGVQTMTMLSRSWHH